MHNSHGMDLVVVFAVHISDSLKSFPYPYPIPGLQHPCTTLGELMFAGYYLWDMKAMGLDHHAYSSFHSQTREKNTSCVTVQAAVPHAVNESIPLDDEGKYLSD